MSRQDEIAEKAVRKSTLKSLKEKKRSRLKQLKIDYENAVQQVNIQYAEDPERLKAKYAADEYAKNTLVPQEKYDLFIKSDKFDRYNLISFSNQIGIDVGIVVGRLQKEGYINYNRFNHLKHKYAYAQ